jgi:hypothetical protein
MKRKYIGFLLVTLLILGISAPLAHPSWPGWGEDFQGRIVENGTPVSGAGIGAEFGCCTESNSSGLFTIGLREGKTRIYILPSGSESVPSAGTFFTITMVGKSATSVTNELGIELPIINGVREFSFSKPNFSGSISTTPPYEGLVRYSRLVSSLGQSDIMGERIKIKSNYAYRLVDKKKYITYFEFRGAQQLFAISPPCDFTGQDTVCPIFDIKSPNLVFRIISSSGIPQNKIVPSVRPVLDGTFLNGLGSWQNIDLTSRFYLADGLYVIEPSLNDLNNVRRYFEVRVKNSQVTRVVDGLSGREYFPNNGVYDLDYLTPTPKTMFSINVKSQFEGGAIFQVSPIPKIDFDISITTTDSASGTKSVQVVEMSPDGLVTVQGRKKLELVQVTMRRYGSEVLAISPVAEIVPSFAEIAAQMKAKQEADAKAAAELKAKQDADAKAAAELKAKQDADAKAAAELKAKQDAEAKATVKKITITCTKGKLTKKVTALKPKCPAGYKLKK